MPLLHKALFENIDISVSGLVCHVLVSRIACLQDKTEK